MNTFSLKIASPDGNIFDGEAVMLSLRGSDGDLAIMANHIALVTGVVPCRVAVRLPEDNIFSGKTSGGILTVRDNTVTLLSSSFEKKNKHSKGDLRDFSAPPFIFVFFSLSQKKNKRKNVIPPTLSFFP